MEENSDFIIVVAKVKLKTNNKSIKELKSSKKKGDSSEPPSKSTTYIQTKV